MSAILSVDNLHVGYGKFRVLHSLSFEVEQGQVLGVIGPNGAGKTTLMNALSGLIMPYDGSILFYEHNITKLSCDKRCRLGLGRTYQIPRPFERLTVFENVLVGASYGTGKTEHAATPLALEVLHTTALYEKRDVMAGQLTLLDRKRLEVARALGTQPKLLLLDEHTAALDPKTAAKVLEITENIVSKNKFTTLMVTHNMKDAITLGNRLLMMSEGKIIFEAEGEAKRRLTVSEMVERFAAV